MKLEHTLQLENLVTGSWRQFLVHVFEGRLTVEDMSRIEAAAAQWTRAHPTKRVELVIVYPSDAGMNSEERSKMAGIMKRWEQVREASATVVLASGLMGSVHRSILTGLQMIAPPPHPTKIFGTIGDAVPWLAPHVQTTCGPEATASAIGAAIEDLCSRFRASRGKPASPAAASSVRVPRE